MTSAVETVETPAYTEYPVMLAHPEHQPARFDEKNVLLKTEQERFPPLMARDEDEEKALTEKGYRRVGEPDGAAFDRAVRKLAGEPIQHIPIVFPMWIAEKEKVVQDAEEYERVTGKSYEGNHTAEPENTDLLASVAADDKPARAARAGAH